MIHVVFMTVVIIILWISGLLLCALALVWLWWAKRPERTVSLLPSINSRVNISDSVISVGAVHCSVLIPADIQSLFWQVVKVRQGLALPDQSQALIFVSVPVASFLVCNDADMAIALDGVLADIVITDTQFHPLLVVSTDKSECMTVSHCIEAAGIGFISMSIDKSAEQFKQALSAKLLALSMQDECDI